MALIKDGYWQDTYWASRYWQEDYWPEYGTAVAPAVAAEGGALARQPRRLPLRFIQLIRDYVASLEAKT